MAQKKIVELKLESTSFRESMKEATQALKDSAEETAKVSREQGKLHKMSQRVNASMAKGVQKVAQSLNRLIKNNPKLTKGFVRAGKAAKRVGKMARSGAKLASRGFKMAGKAMKTAFAATGILALIGGLAGILQRSQKVRDLMDKLGRTIGIVVDRAINAVSGLVEKFGGVSGVITKIKEGLASAFTLDGLKKFGQAIIDNVVERIRSAIDVVGHLATAAYRVLKLDFAGAAEAVGDAGKEMVDVWTGVPDTVEKVGKIATGVAEKVAEEFTDAFSLASMIQEAEKNAGILENEYAGIKAKMEEALEAEREIADDGTRSTEERLAANERYKQSVEDGIAKQRANLKEQIATQNLILQGQADNQEALEKKQKLESDLANLNKEATAFNKEANIRQRAIIMEGNTLMGESIQHTMTMNSLRADGLKIGKSEEEQLNIDKQLIEENAKIEKDSLTARMQDLKDKNLETSKEYQQLQQRLQQLEQETKNAVKEIEDEKNQIREDARKENEDKADEDADKAIAREEYIKNKKIELASAGFAAAASLAEAFQFKNEAAQRKAFNVSKALRVGEATMNTYQGVTSILADDELPTTLKPVAIGIAVATGLANVAKIASTQFKGGSSGSAPKPQKMSVPVAGSVGQSTINGINASRGNNNGGEPLRAYVVGSDVKTQAELDRKRTDRATL